MCAQLRPLSLVTQTPPSLPDQQVIGIRRIDPDGVHVAVDVAEALLRRTFLPPSSDM